MSMAGKKMKRLDEEIARLDAEILRLQAERAGLVRAKTILSAGDELITPARRKRSANIKPLILDFMRNVGPTGATSGEVSAFVSDQVPTVAKDTVGSILSRLKADNALAYNGERYFETRFAPKPEQRPFEPKVVAS